MNVCACACVCCGLCVCVCVCVLGGVRRGRAYDCLCARGYLSQARHVEDGGEKLRELESSRGLCHESRRRKLPPGRLGTGIGFWPGGQKDPGRIFFPEPIPFSYFLRSPGTAKILCSAAMVYHWLRACRAPLLDSFRDRILRLVAGHGHTDEHENALSLDLQMDRGHPPRPHLLHPPFTRLPPCVSARCFAPRRSLRVRPTRSMPPCCAHAALLLRSAGGVPPAPGSRSRSRPAPSRGL